MKRLLLFLLTSTAALVSYAQEDTWQRVTVADSVTVEFPAAPKKYTQNGVTVYSVYQGSVLYSVATMKNPDGKSVTEEDRRKFYDGAIKGAIKQVNATEIGDTTGFYINGFKGIRITLQAQTDALRGPVTLGALFVHDTAFTLFFCGADNETNLAARRHFFQSFQPRQRPAPPVMSRAYRLGEMMGRLAFYGLLLAGILYLARLPGKKNRSKTSA
jgi:hypothetical protein